MLQQIWELIVQVYVGDLIVPALNHPLITVTTCGALMAVAIWKH